MIEDGAQDAECTAELGPDPGLASLVGTFSPLDAAQIFCPRNSLSASCPNHFLSYTKETYLSLSY